MSTVVETKGWVARHLHVTELRRRLLAIANAPHGASHSAVQTGNSTLARIRDTWLEARRELLEDESIPIDARRELLSQMRQDTKTVIAGVVESEEAHAQNHRAELQPAPAGRLPDSTHERLWRQLERRLNSGADLNALINRASRDELQVLGEEAPSLIEAATMGDAGKRGTMAKATVAALEKRWRELATPEEAQRFEALDRLDAGLNRFRVGAAHLVYDVEQDEVEPTPIPSWADDAVM